MPSLPLLPLLLLLLITLTHLTHSLRFHQLPSNGGLTAREISVNATAYPAHTIPIPIDHYNAADTRTYQNRYWINDEYYRRGGPAFCFDAGEQNARPLVPYFLHEAAGPSAVMALARRCDIPECGVPPPNDTVFGIVYRDMVHVSDMRALLNTSDVNHQNFSTVGFSSPISTEPFYAGVGLFQQALEAWLPCFANGSYGDMTFHLPGSP
ncbi:hypothetical protein LTR16_005133 [Cryomyces antarcticus]|uniref:Uncharacterized protein n=1 Tax=Cryomyces antarcticus TaxID=329879 RepID=A0ABR0LWW9_9PEZI|nr:hypothetical protein LTR39_004554 [Cryomyces antarcticus]KAK5015129.1 hypothetical protein LTR60_003020 [Cryomyces antarcticus]KAK5253498.1 hypothetical protein LTR16_005133 [Cryomyces antarcticus]